MKLALSTNWNARRHEFGEGLVDDALELGFDALELGYDTTEQQADGVRRRIEEGKIEVGSVHAFCPVPFNAPHGYPELHLLASEDEDERAMAALLLKKTLSFAQRMDAKAVVLHAGRVYLRSFWGDLGSNILVDRFDVEGKLEAKRYQRYLKAALRRRARRAKKIMSHFCAALEPILPLFEKAGVQLCLENLPSIEAYPDEEEIAVLMERFKGSPLRYWHDIGHGQIRANMGWSGDHLETVRKLLPIIGGIHIHDCVPPANDAHIAAGEGETDFAQFAFFGEADILRVFEPSPRVSWESLQKSVALIRKLWIPPQG
ncbi:MAG: sugar phosphate isomerase/epimerase [Kiritimatiellae bacterium]|nr:sugar phosphate isomerase/epimerase [Kiritimatiellia bacterium]